MSSYYATAGVFSKVRQIVDRVQGTSAPAAPVQGLKRLFPDLVYQPSPTQAATVVFSPTKIIIGVGILGAAYFLLKRRR